MNDLEHELRELLETKSRDARVDPVPARGVLRRARLRQAGVAVGSAVVAAAVVIGSIAGLQAVLGPTKSAPIVTSVDTTPTTTLPAGVTVTYRRDWVLVDLWPLVSGIATSVVSEGGDGPSTEEPIDVPAGLPILQLANQDLGLAPFCRDGGTPSTDEAVLYVALDVDAQQAGRTLPAWPIEPAPESGPCGEGFYAHWEAEGTPYLAYLGLGGEAPLADRDVMFDAFESLAFEPFELAVPESTTPGYVLVSLGSGDVRLNLELRRKKDGSVWLELASPLRLDEVRSGMAVSTGPDVPGIDYLVAPIGPTNGDSTGFELGAIVFGMVPDPAARIEIETDEGQIVKARILPFPRSVEGSLRAFVAELPAAAGEITAFDADGQVLYSESFAAGVATASPALLPEPSA